MLICLIKILEFELVDWDFMNIGRPVKVMKILQVFGFAPSTNQTKQKMKNINTPKAQYRKYAGSCNGPDSQVVAYALM